jgi:hypothetical protein
MVVTHIVGSHRAFAALTDAGAVVCWGDSEAGGDCALAALVGNFDELCVLHSFDFLYKLFSWMCPPPLGIAVLRVDGFMGAARIICE